MSATESSHASRLESISEMERSTELSLVKESKHKSAKWCALTSRSARMVEATMLTLVIVCAIVLLSLPSALHFVKQVSLCISMHDQTLNACMRLCSYLYIYIHIYMGFTCTSYTLKQLTSHFKTIRTRLYVGYWCKLLVVRL